jgi:hypothetical protein
MPEATESHSTTYLARPPRRPATVRELTDDIVKSYQHFVGRLAAIPPHTIGATLVADEEDLILRAEHLRIVLRATADYVGAFMRDTDDFTHAMQFDRKYLDGIFDDVIGDTVGAIENAADRLGQERAARAA